MKHINKYLFNNDADENISKMIIVAIAFVVGAILLVILASAFKGPIAEWWKGVINEWFNDDTGAIDNGTRGTQPEIGFDGPGDTL